MRQIIAIIIGILITFFIINWIAEHGLKITRLANADETQGPKEVLPEAKPEFKLPWQSFSDMSNMLSNDENEELITKRCSGEDFFQYKFVYSGKTYSYAALDERWAIWLYQKNKVVFMWLGHYQPGSDAIVPTWAMSEKDMKTIFPGVCSWLIQQIA